MLDIALIALKQTVFIYNEYLWHIRMLAVKNQRYMASEAIFKMLAVENHKDNIRHFRNTPSIHHRFIIFSSKYMFLRWEF